MICFRNVAGNWIKSQSGQKVPTLRANYQLVSKARRIRYSRHFFPEKVSELCAQLFTELEQESMGQASSDPSSHQMPVNEAGQVEADKPVESEPLSVGWSSWTLVQGEEFTQDDQE